MKSLFVPLLFALSVISSPIASADPIESVAEAQNAFKDWLNDCKFKILSKRECILEAQMLFNDIDDASINEGSLRRKIKYLTIMYQMETAVKRIDKHVILGP